MGALTDRNEIDARAAELFGRDHPDRSWDPLDDPRRLGVASALEKAVYRGFATARFAAETRAMPGSVIAAAALVADSAAAICAWPAIKSRA